jgi:hypothetical protein
MACLDHLMEPMTLGDVRELGVFALQFATAAVQYRSRTGLSAE